MNNKKWILFSSSFYLSAFTFGGGYVIVSLLRKKYVEDLGWIDENEMMDMVAIAQSAPGSLTVNASIMVGYKIDGFMGALVSTLGTLLPPLILLTLIAYFYTNVKDNVIVNAALMAMSAGIAAVVLDVMIKMFIALLKEKRRDSIPILLFVLISTLIIKMNILLVIFMIILYGVMKTYWGNKRDLS